MRLGLAPSYQEKTDKFWFIWKLLALPLLPHEHIAEAFMELEDQGAQGGCEQIVALTSYIRTTWIDGRIWRPTNWSVFRETVRTNNCVEGWHRRINSRANGLTLPFYVLVPLLRREAEEVKLNIRLVSENLLTRDRRTCYRNIYGKLFGLWDKYEDGDLSTSRLLRGASMLLGLGPIPEPAEAHDEDVQ